MNILPIPDFTLTVKKLIRLCDFLDFVQMCSLSHGGHKFNKACTGLVEWKGNFQVSPVCYDLDTLGLSKDTVHCSLDTEPVNLVSTSPLGHQSCTNPYPSLD